MSPYRKPPMAAPERRPDPTPEEVVLYGLLIAVGAIPVAIALARGGTFGVEPTLGLGMVCTGLVGIVLHARTHRRA